MLRRHSSFVDRLWWAGLALAGVLFFGVAPLSAQGPSDCTTHGAVKRGDGADLQCRMDVLLQKHEALLTTFEDKMGPCTDTPKRCQLIQDRLERAQRAHDRATRSHGRLTSEDFSDLNRKRKGKAPPGGGTTSAFSTLSSFPTAAAPEDDVDPGIGEDLADQIDDTSAALDAANESIQEQEGPVVTPPVHASLYDYTADPNYPKWLHIGPSSTVAQFSVLTALEVAKGLNDWFGKVCEQTAVVAGFGGNTSTACVVLAIAVSATWELMDFRSGDTDSWEMHGAYVRSGQIFDNLSSLNSTVGSVTESIGDLGPQLDLHDADVKALLDKLQKTVDSNTQQLKVLYAFQRTILKLLLTQDGQKAIDPSLLVCTGDDCPLVVFDCPGGQCKFPMK